MYPFEVKQYKVADDGVYLRVFVPDKEIINDIMKYKTKTGSIKLDDNRKITAKQQKRIYLTIKDIADYLGYFPKEAEQLLIENFNISYNENLTSIPECSMSLARKFLAYLLEFCLYYNIPLSDYALNRIDNNELLVYLCLKYKKCTICGDSNSETHHYDALGMGVDRKTYDDSKLRKIQLCRIHHQEAETIGKVEFEKKYKVHGIVYSE